MRLSIPKLSQFFHRRSKSDPALSRRLAPPPARRPLSASVLEGLAHLRLPLDFNLPLDAPSGSSRSLPSELLARVPTTPIALPPSHSHPYPHPRPVSLATLSSTASAAASTASGASSSTTISAASHTVVVEVLTRRITELEAELAAAPRPPTEVPSDTLDGTRIAPGSPSLVDHPASAPTDTDIMLTLLAPCSDRTMLADAYRRVRAGDDPEDALVDAIRAAAAVTGSTWRRLLAPVTGPRAPESYAAQVRCTLAARRETRGWRTRAAFWRASARLGGAHMETVTPSASQLSDVVRELEAGEGARNWKGKEVQPVQVRVEVSVQTQTDAPPEVDNDPTPRPPAVIRLGAPREKIPSVQQIFATTAATITASAPATVALYENQNPARGSTPPRKGGTDDASTSAARSSPSTYGNLPPLASVAFRESHSISSRRDLVGLSASASSSSQESRVSQKRNGVILEASSSDLRSQAQARSQAQSQTRVRSTGPLATGSLATTGSGSGTASISGAGLSSGAGSVTASGSGLGSRANFGTGISDSGSSASATRTATPTDSDSPASTGSWDRLSSFMARSFSFGFGNTLHDTLAIETPGARTPAPSLKPTPKLKSKANSFTLNANVSINPSPTPAPTRRPDPLPNRRQPQPSPTPSRTRTTTTTRTRTPSPLSSANSSPAKSPKSRLPLPVGGGITSPPRPPPPKRTFMKRLSLAISKPVLVDSTNAGAAVVGEGAGSGSGAGVTRYGLMQKRGAHTQTMAPVKEAGPGTTGVKRRAETSPEKAKASGKKVGGWDKGKKARVDENANEVEAVAQQSKGKGTVRTRLMRKQA